MAHSGMACHQHWLTGTSFSTPSPSIPRRGHPHLQRPPQGHRVLRAQRQRHRRPRRRRVTMRCAAAWLPMCGAGRKGARTECGGAANAAPRALVASPSAERIASLRQRRRVCAPGRPRLVRCHTPWTQRVCASPSTAARSAAAGGQPSPAVAPGPGLRSVATAHVGFVEPGPCCPPICDTDAV